MRRRGDKLDSKAMGFGNTRNLSDSDLRLFDDARQKFKNMMDGVIAFCEIEKQNSDMWCEVNTNKIVLDFLKFLDRQKKQLKDLKELDKDKRKMENIAKDLFGKGNKQGSDMVLYRSLFEKAVYYGNHEYVPTETPVDPGISVEDVLTRITLFLDNLYGRYVKKRNCKEQYYDLHEAIYFSSHIRKSTFLQTDMERVANDFTTYLYNNDIPANELKKTRMNKIKIGRPNF